LTKAKLSLKIRYQQWAIRGICFIARTKIPTPYPTGTLGLSFSCLRENTALHTVTITIYCHWRAAGLAALCQQLLTILLDSLCMQWLCSRLHVLENPISPLPFPLDF